MAQPTLLQDSFARMVQDVPRDELPRDACWVIQDYLPDIGLNVADPAVPDASGGRLMKRGGWMYASEDVATDATSATSITAMGLLNVNSRLCLATDNNKFGYITLPADGAEDFTLVSSSCITTGKQPFVHLDNVLIITGTNGTTAPQSYDGTTFGNLAGSPPAGQYAAVWNDRLILGNTAAEPRRSYFSALGNAASWDTTYGYVDVLRNITGYAVLPNALLIFGADQTARVRGKVPPPGSPDMVVDDPIFNTGCTFANSIAVNGPSCVFANEEGVFVTDGTSNPRDLTKACGVKSTWQRYAAQSIRPAGGSPDPGLDNVYGGFLGGNYFVTQRPTNYSNISFLFDVANESCTTHTNFAPNSAAMTPQIGDELYLGIGTRVVATSPIFLPTGGTKADADGTAITPVLETRFFLDTASHKKRWRAAYIDYRMDDSASDNPTLAVSYTTNPQGDSFTALATLAETSDSTNIRAKMRIHKLARGMAFKIQQAGNSSITSITSLLADVHAREAGRV